MHDAVWVALITDVPIVVGLWFNNRRTRNVQNSIGPVNGSSLTEIIASQRAFDEYQHARNHDILNALTKIGLGIEQLLRERPPA